MIWIKEFLNLISIGNRRGAILVFSYRLAHYLAFGWKKYIGIPYLIVYHIIIRWFLSFDVHEKTYIGTNFCPWHCFGITINPKTIIGNNVVIRQNTTIGEKNNKAPVIGNNVEISASCNIIGNIKIGDGSTIGIGSVVTKDVLPKTIVAGNPAKIIKII